MLQKKVPQIARVESGIVKVTEEVLDSAEQVVEATGAQLEDTIAPLRKSVLRRFPVLFLLAVTFGFTAVVTGMEQLLVQHEVLQNHPGVILFAGIGVLTLTGTLYKKLG